MDRGAVGRERFSFQSKANPLGNRIEFIIDYFMYKEQLFSLRWDMWLDSYAFRNVVATLWRVLHIWFIYIQSILVGELNYVVKLTFVGFAERSKGEFTYG